MNINSKVILIIILLFIVTISFAEEISVPQTMLKSAIFPGWGQLSLGNKTGYAFIASETILWAARIYYIEEQKLQKQKSFNFAVKYAHIDPHQHYDDLYFEHLRSFNSSGYSPGGYNAYIVERAQHLYPNDIDKQNEYISQNAYDEDYYWNWDDRDRRREYGVIRKYVVHYSDYAKAFMGTIIVNRLANVIHAALSSSKMRAEQNLNFSVNFDLDMNPTIQCIYRF